MDKLKELKEQYERLGETINQLKEEKIDFSEYVGRDGNLLCIKGDTLLSVNERGGLLYDEYIRKNYTDELHYKKTTLDELEKGDVFIRCCDVYDMTLKYFSVFMGSDSDGDYVCQNIIEYGGVENIKQDYLTYNAEVYKFLRE